MLKNLTTHEPSSKGSGYGVLPGDQGRGDLKLRTVRGLGVAGRAFLGISGGASLVYVQDCALWESGLGSWDSSEGEWAAAAGSIGTSRRLQMGSRAKNAKRMLRTLHVARHHDH